MRRFNLASSCVEPLAARTHPLTSDLTDARSGVCLFQYRSAEASTSRSNSVQPKPALLGITAARASASHPGQQGSVAESQSGRGSDLPGPYRSPSEAKPVAPVGRSQQPSARLRLGSRPLLVREVLSRRPPQRGVHPAKLWSRCRRPVEPDLIGSPLPGRDCQSAVFPSRSDPR